MDAYGRGAVELCDGLAVTFGYSVRTSWFLAPYDDLDIPAVGIEKETSRTRLRRRLRAEDMP